MSKIEFLSPEGLRVDGRRPAELRMITSRLGVFDQADGSAYFAQGNTKVLATVYGPHEPSSRMRMRHDRVFLNCEFSQASFASTQRKKRSKGERGMTELEVIIVDTFEPVIMGNLYPRSQIDIYIQVLQSDGGDLCACVNAATLALVDAGVAMKDLVCACAAGSIDTQPILDVNYLESQADGPSVPVAILPKSKSVLMIQLESRLHVEQFSHVLDLAVEGCHQVGRLMEATIRENVEALAASVGAQNLN